MGYVNNCCTVPRGSVHIAIYRSGTLWLCKAQPPLSYEVAIALNWWRSSYSSTPLWPKLTLGSLGSPLEVEAMLINHVAGYLVR